MHLLFTVRCSPSMVSCDSYWGSIRKRRQSFSAPALSRVGLGVPGIVPKWTPSSIARVIACLIFSAWARSSVTVSSWRAASGGSGFSSAAKDSVDVVMDTPQSALPPRAPAWAVGEMLGELVARDLEAPAHQAAGRGPRPTDGPSEC